MTDLPEVSIIIPLYNEEENISPLTEELLTTLKSLEHTSEIIFVDDGSRDNSFDVIKTLALDDSRIRGISLLRNLGQEWFFQPAWGRL